MKEVIVDIPKDCDKKKSKEYMKVYDKGKCVEFSLVLINRCIVVSKKEQSLSLHYRLFARTHVPDIVLTSGKEAVNLASKEGIIIATIMCHFFS